jgi:hypothetical protein
LSGHVVALVRCRSGSCIDEDSASGGKTLDARKVDRSGATVPLSSEPRPVDRIESCDSLSAAEKTAILGSSALRCSDSNA